MLISIAISVLPSIHMYDDPCVTEILFTYERENNRRSEFNMSEETNLAFSINQLFGAIKFKHIGKQLR